MLITIDNMVNITNINIKTTRCKYERRNKKTNKRCL